MTNDFIESRSIPFKIVSDYTYRMSPSLEIKDYDPSFALRKIAMLYENDRREDVIKIISNLAIDTLLEIYTEFPIDLFLDSIPQSLGILDCLMSRIFEHVRT